MKNCIFLFNRGRHLIWVLLLIAASAQSQGWQYLGPDEYDQFSISHADFVHAAKGPGNSLYVTFQDQASGNKAVAWRFSNNVWSKLGNDAISTGIAFYTDIAVNSAGVPFVVYQDVASGYKAIVKKFNGSSWETVGQEGFSVGGVFSTRIAISPNDVPYVVFGDISTGNKATVYRLNGSAWEPVGAPGISVGKVDYTAIAIAPDGTPYIVYSDFGLGSKATVKKFNGSAWVNAGNAGFSDGVAEYTEIAVSSTNVPFVLYRESSTGYKVTVKQLSGSSWTTVGNAGFSAAVSSELSIAISPSDIIHVAYRDYSAGYGATVKRFVNGQWESVGGEGKTQGASENLSLVAMDNTTLYLAFSNWKANVIRYDGNTWTLLKSTGVTPGINEKPKISTGNNNKPYVTCSGAAVGLGPVAVWTYVSPSWTPLPQIPVVGTSIEYLNIKTDDNGNVYIAFLSGFGSTAYIVVMKYDGTGWSTLSNEGIDEYVYSFDFALDKLGTPYLAYHGPSGGSKFTVSRFNGTGWEPVGNVFAFLTLTRKLAFSEDNTPFLAYYKEETHGITVQKFDGIEWKTIGNPDFILSWGGSFDFAVDPAGVPYVLNKDLNDPRLRLYQYKDDTWKTLGDTIHYTDMLEYAIALGGRTPYVVFEGSQTDKWKGFVKKWNGQKWVILGDVPFSAYSIKWPSIHVTKERTVYVAYDSYGVFVQSFDDACTLSTNINGPDTVLTNQGALFNTAEGFTEYSWNAGAGTVVSGQGTAHLQINFPVAGVTSVSVTVTDVEGCTATATFPVLVTTPVATETLSPENLRIAPNPFSDFLRIEGLSAAGSSRIARITDVSGRIYWEKAGMATGETVWVETRSWPPGIYFLRMETNDGQIVWRMVKI